MPELLDELSIARSGGTLKKVLESYKKKDLLILDEWLIRPLSPQESYDMLEIVEARCHKSTIFCTQYESEGWYTRIDPNPESDSPVSEAIMDRIMHRKAKSMPRRKTVHFFSDCGFTRQSSALQNVLLCAYQTATSSI